MYVVRGCSVLVLPPQCGEVPWVSRDVMTVATAGRPGRATYVASWLAGWVDAGESANTHVAAAQKRCDGELWRGSPAGLVS